MGKIARYHWALDKQAYIKGVANDRFKTDWDKSLDIQLLPPDKTTYEEVYPRLVRVGWQWEHKSINQEQALRDRLSKDGTQIYLLLDDKREIGFALLSTPEMRLFRNFNFSARNKTIKEIEDLALYPDEAGKGRGKSWSTGRNPRRTTRI